MSCFNLLKYLVILGFLGVKTSSALAGEMPKLEDRTDYEKLFVYRCETIEETIGFADTPSGQATKYSCDSPAIGIALYAGKDLGKHPPEKVGKHFVDELAKFGMKSEVFINPDHEHGSSMGFYINGDSWLRNAVRPSEAVGMIEALAAEAKLILFTDGKLNVWPKSVKRP